MDNADKYQPAAVTSSGPLRTVRDLAVSLTKQDDCKKDLQISLTLSSDDTQPKRFMSLGRTLGTQLAAFSANREALVLVCMRAYMYVCTCMYVSMSICTICMCALRYIHQYAYVYVRMYVCMRVYIYTYVKSYIKISIHMYVFCMK